MLKFLCVTAVLIASVPVAVMAEPSKPQRSGTPEEQKACAKDVARHCRALMDEPDLVVLGCLQQHRPAISAACNKVLTDNGQ